MTLQSKIPVFVLMLLCCKFILAQTDNTANQVMQKVNEALLQSNCDGAQRAYSTWKDLTGQTNISVENRIKSCRDTKMTATQELAVGQIYQDGRIAYLDDSGKHGWLIMRKSKKPISPSDFFEYEIFPSNERLPTKEELLIIYENKNILGLYNEYLSSSVKRSEKNWDIITIVYSVNFSNNRINRYKYESNVGLYFFTIKDF